MDKELCNQIINLHEQCNTPIEIGKILNCNRNTVTNYLKKLGLIPYTIRSKNISKISKLLDEGKTNLEIAKILDLSPTTVRKYTKEYLHRDTNSIKTKCITKEKLTLTDTQLEVLYGSLLGDMCITKETKNARISITHSGLQEEYFDYKCNIFKNLIGKVDKSDRYDKRTNKYYKKCAVRLLAHPLYNELYNTLYINGIKTITRDWLDKLTPLSIAIWFMDDGSNCGTIATNCFSIEECELIKTWFLEKYNIQTSIHKAANNQHVLYILKNSRNIFYDLVIDYFIPSMYYKLENWNLKPRELRETP